MPMYVFIPVMLFPMILAIGLWLLRRRALAESDEISPVSRQHFELLQGGELNPKLVEAVKRRFQVLLDRGDVAAVEARLTPGEEYVVGVRALAELGTDAAANILERQLNRKLSNDQIEQTWYRIDLASGLRQLNRAESLPRLLGCADASAAAPLGNVFAAETLCFEGFEDYLKRPRSKLGRAALQVTRRVFEGFRFFLQPQIVTESRMGEMIESIWDRRTRPAQAEVVRVLHETQRYLRRVPSALAMLEDEPAEREAFEWQVARMQALETPIEAELKTAAEELLNQLPGAAPHEQREILLALTDLRVETAGTIVPLLQRRALPDIDLALGALRWSRDVAAGVWMRDYARSNVDLESRARPGRAWMPRRDHITIPYAALLRALRGQMSSATEELLVQAASDRDPNYRLAAVSSLGWWEPVAGDAAIQRLEEARRDPHPDVRRAARAALARLGERSALQWFRQALLGDNLGQRHEAIHFIAVEGLTLLWPDLDRLMESDNAGIAYRAREALVVLSEDMSI